MTPALPWSRIFRTVLLVVPLGVAANLAFALWTSHSHPTPAGVDLKWHWLVPAVLAGFGPWFTAAERLRRWTVFLGRPLAYSRCLHISMGADLGAAVTPTAVGGGYLKLGMLVQDGFPSNRAAVLMIAGSVEDGLALAMAVPAAFAAAGGHRGLELDRFIQLPGTAAAVACAVAAAALVCVVLSMRIRGEKEGRSDHAAGRRWKAFTRDFQNMAMLVRRGGKRVLAGNVLLAGLHWILRFEVVTLWFAFLDFPIRPDVFFFYQWVTYVLTSFVVTPGGIGGLEAVFCAVFGSYIRPGMTGIATAGWRIVSSHVPLIVASVLFFRRELRSGSRLSLNGSASASEKGECSEILLRAEG